MSNARKEFIAWDGEGVTDIQREMELAMEDLSLEPDSVFDKIVEEVRKVGIKRSVDYPFLSRRYIKSTGFGIDDMVDILNSKYGQVIEDADHLYEILERAETEREHRKVKLIGKIQKYVFIASSKGDILEDWEHGLYGPEFIKNIFELFLKYDKRYIQVIFGGSYDFTMILRGLPYVNLRELRESSESQTEWEGYKIRYIRSKFLKISKGDRKAIIYDVISFFQKSFAKVLKTFFDDLTDVEQREIEEIVSQKKRREDFSIEERELIKHYNMLELKWLVKIMDKVKMLSSKQGLYLRTYTGAGSYANALLTKHKIRFHYKNGDNTLIPEQILDISRQAYFGGRAEIFVSGLVDKPVYNYDINSAYPYAISKLPSMRFGYWEHKRGLAKSDVKLFGLYYIKWDYKDAVVGGFPLRSRYASSLLFPDCGVGWFWGPEVLANIEYVKRHPEWLLDIQEGYIFHDDGRRPFEWVLDDYERRLELKRIEEQTGKHSAESDMIKLGLNSISGKFAQRVGAHVEDHPPRFHNISYAGFVTSYTRAMILRSIIGHEDDILMVATDGLFSMKPLEYCEARLSLNIGDFEKHVADAMFLVQAGFYFVRYGDKWSSKTRGVLRRAMTDEVLHDTIEGFLRGQREFTFPINKFMTISQVNEHNYEYIGSWITATKRNDFGKTVKMLNDDKREWLEEVGGDYIRSYAVHNPFPDEPGIVPKFKWGVDDEALSEYYSLVEEDEMVNLDFMVEEEV